MKNNNIYSSKFQNCIFTYKLKQILKEKNISIYKLEKDTGLDHKTIQNYCYGTLKRLDLNSIAIICSYLKCTFDELVSFNFE